MVCAGEAMPGHWSRRRRTVASAGGAGGPRRDVADRRRAHIRGEPPGGQYVEAACERSRSSAGGSARVRGA
jgi:hypothetical protein